MKKPSLLMMPGVVPGLLVLSYGEMPNPMQAPPGKRCQHPGETRAQKYQNHRFLSDISMNAPGNLCHVMLMSKPLFSTVLMLMAVYMAISSNNGTLQA
jgi:hypothetical protein